MGEPIDRVDKIFGAALELSDPTQRAIYLDKACGGDEQLRREVESLLSVHDRAGDFMEEPLAALPVGGGSGSSGVGPVAEKAGDRIGHYKLLEQIGEGGFGTVWMAEQQEPVRRRVALKVIKLGMDTKQVVARFEAERQALALMDHPNIARVFDGGATETGRPYFVMELVKGIPITKYCDANRLSTRERLGLFGQVCRALQHAHQKGVIHRDLKPSNVLVTVQDDRPLPKVIDFGVAKATEARLTDKTLFTGLQQLIGTPAYMSPEQAGLGSLDIDTRSDIYSLGVLLYELLTGHTPFDTRMLLKEGYDAVFRTIREVDPPKPSTRLSTLERADLTDIARHRQSEPPKLLHQVRGELDWIVMKCLEKDRTRRYETANGLATDLERYLKDEPVVAGPPSARYRAKKFLKKHQTAVAVLAGFGLLLTMATVVSVALALWANRERASAKANEKTAITESSKSRQVAQFLRDMLQGVRPSVALGRDTTMLREILDKTAERLGKDLKNQPEVEAELRLILGKTYQELAQYPEALAMTREALRLRQAVFGLEHQAVASALESVAAVLYDQGDLAGAEAIGHEALAMRRKLLGAEHLDVAAALNTLGNVLQTRHDLAGAEAAHREALAIRKKLLGEHHLDVARSLNNLANVLAERGDAAGAEPLFREALTLFKKLMGEQHPISATVCHNLGILLSRTGDLPAAEALHREALTMRRSQFGAEHPSVAVSLNELAMLSAAKGDLIGAEAMVQEAMTNRLLRREQWRFTTTINTLAIVLSKKGDLAAAEAKYREALELRKKLLAPDHPMVAESLNGLANLLAARGDLAGAEVALRETLVIRKRAQGDEHPDLISTLWPLAWVRRQQADITEAESLHRQAVSLSLQRGAYSVVRLVESIYDVADLLQVQEKFAEAEPLLLEASNHLQNDHSASAPVQRRLLERLVRFYNAWGKPDQAAEWRQKLR